MFLLDAYTITRYIRRMNRPILTVSLDAIVANWQLLRTRHAEKNTAAVVKADAYGLGVAPVAKALHDAGCEVFFVATLQEAIELREALPDVPIYVFQGMLQGEAALYQQHRLKPVINTVAQLQEWARIGDNHEPAALHIDTAMQRLGLDISELEQCADIAKAAHLDLLMTHYACASDLGSAVNVRQHQLMQRAERVLPDLPTSYANSAGHFLGAEYHGGMTRPGCALYGINPCDDMESPLHPVANLTAPILQVRTIHDSATLGYCATTHVSHGMKTVTVGIGYADGIHRTGSNALYGFIDEYRLPLLGRVTMDMLCFDASHVPDAVLEAATFIELMGKRQTVDDLARIYGTIGYEVLTSFGGRVERVYQ